MWGGGVTPTPPHGLSPRSEGSALHPTRPGCCGIPGWLRRSLRARQHHRSCAVVVKRCEGGKIILEKKRGGTGKKEEKLSEHGRESVCAQEGGKFLLGFARGMERRGGMPGSPGQRVGTGGLRCLYSASAP